MATKTIFMTYKNKLPEKVFNRWKQLNSEYQIDFSLDHECVSFLKCNFNEYIVDLFNSIQRGAYKADLWRLCKLYVNGGVYADIDLVPYLSIDNLDKDITFYTCLSIDKRSIFQAFMASFTKPKNPLILCFLLSYLHNNPHTYFNGPTFDMYNCMKYNLNNLSIIPEKKYDLGEVKIKINIGSSTENIKNVNLYYFPDKIEYTVKLISHCYQDTFDFTISNNILIVRRIDQNTGWSYNHSVDICIESKESIFLFTETIDPGKHWSTAYVLFNNKRILDSRDMEYYHGLW